MQPAVTESNVAGCRSWTLARLLQVTLHTTAGPNCSSCSPKPKACSSCAGNFCGALLAYFGATVIKASTLPMFQSLQSTTPDRR